MMKAVSLLLLLVSGTAFAADDASILKCRTIPGQAERLACYDALPAGAQAAVAPASPVAYVAPAKDAAPAAVVAAKTAEQNFGLETVKKKKEPEAAPSAIESTLVGSFQGWGPTSQFRLANGQVWKVIDGSQAALDPMTNPKVKVVRNFFGTLFMEFEGTNHSPKVRRVQ